MFSMDLWRQSALIGDACHAIVPFMVKGMNAGFEDISILYEMMEIWRRLGMFFQNMKNHVSRMPMRLPELSYRNFLK
jgi:kynurenine 3-monooxygenase